MTDNTLQVSKTYLWKAARALHPGLWAWCETGEQPEYIVEDCIEWSLEETFRMINCVR